jgi:ABC-type sugar transport system permease subunit
VAALVLVLGAPLAWTFWDSLHLHDLRVPGSGHPFIGLANYREAFGDERFAGAAVRTAFFVAVSVGLELVLGTALALTLHRAYRGRGVVRTVALLPWAIPTIVTAIMWRFLFEGSGAPVNQLLAAIGASGEVSWFAGARTAWIPLLLADVWKTTPFVAIIVLGGLTGIPRELAESAWIDGAGRTNTLVHVTLPLLRPALLVALLFRSLDALRVFDLVYVLTSGGPGDATEPVALYTFQILLQNLRFGYGAALSVLIFATSFAISVLWIRALGRDVQEPA